MCSWPPEHFLSSVQSGPDFPPFFDAAESGRAHSELQTVGLDSSPPA